MIDSLQTNGRSRAVFFFCYFSNPVRKRQTSSRHAISISHRCSSEPFFIVFVQCNETVFNGYYIPAGSALRESKYTKGIVRCEMVDSHSDNDPTKKTEKIGKETEKEEEEEQQQQQQ